MVASTLTLKETLRLALERPPRWLHEPEAIPQAPDWVALSLEELHPGDILILGFSECTPAALRQAQHKGAALVICLGKAPEVPPEFSLPLAVVEEKIDKRTLQKRLSAVLINARAAIIERGARIHAQLAQLEAEGRGLEGLVQAMAEMTARGVILQDKRGMVLAHHPSTTLAGIWPDILAQFSELRPLPEAFLDRKRVGSQPTIHCQNLDGGLSCLIAPVVVGEVARGYLSLVGVQGEFDSLDYLVAEQGGLVLAIEMARNKAIRETEKRLKGDLLNALLQEVLTPRDARLWLQAMGLNPQQAHVALRFMWDMPTPPSRRRLETIINGEIAQRSLRAIVHPMGSEVICFCPVDGEAPRPAEAIALAEGVLRQAQREYPQAVVRCGIGTPALALGEWRVSFTRAGQALDMARRLNEKSPLYYPDLSVYRLLLQLEHSPELIAFQEEILGNLLATENPQELINTLEAFFAHNGNLSQTAEALYIHRNTLVYRLERIAAITKIDLDKPENRLAVQLALHIYRMTRPLDER
ncbi:MAG: helix-turn-helix domain-containing protein [Anaerolineales bacterium]|nr:helix-turn-helix domain-containing protein [Anaerolineales bacterium]MDW8447870.1 helix-turn-helix domain-containing protein [Anaerolineales bacterium]